MMKKVGLFLVFVCVVAIVGGSRLLRLNDSNAVYSDQKIDLYLRKKISLPELSNLLVDSLHVVKDKEDLQWAANLLGWKNYQPGHYAIDQGFTYDAFLSRLARGIQDPVSLTIVPGQSEEKILTFLSANLRFDSLAIYKIVNDSTYLAKRDLNQEVLVGHLFPATYDLYWTSPPKKVFQRIFDEFDKQVVNLYQQKADTLNESLNQILALASIIEWEAIHDNEKAKISGLYWNRLNKDMYLQSDPTVNYAVGEQRRLYYKDYEVDDPYNTYVNKGLPPGPINNPSLSSIKAALNPEQHDYVYMVAQPNGYHAFSKTYAQHQQNSEEWKEYLRKMEDSTTVVDSSKSTTP